MAIVRSLTVGLVTFSGGCTRDILVGLMDGADNSINNGLAWKSSIFAIYVNKGKDCINEKKLSHTPSSSEHLLYKSCTTQSKYEITTSQR